MISLYNFHITFIPLSFTSEFHPETDFATANSPEGFDVLQPVESTSFSFTAQNINMEATKYQHLVVTWSLDSPFFGSTEFFLVLFQCRVLSLVEAPGASYFASLTEEEEQSISGTKSVVNNTSWMAMKQPWPRTLDHIHDVYGSGLSMRETGYVGYAPGTHIYIYIYM